MRDLWIRCHDVQSVNGVPIEQRHDNRTTNIYVPADLPAIVSRVSLDSGMFVVVNIPNDEDAEDHSIICDHVTIRPQTVDSDE